MFITVAPSLKCPFCGSEKVVQNMVEWAAHSTEPTDRDNAATLNEHQCAVCHASFWT